MDRPSASAEGARQEAAVSDGTPPGAAPSLFGIPAARWNAAEPVVRARIARGTLASLRHRIVYAFVPKAACTTLKTALADCLPKTGATRRVGSPEVRAEMRIHQESALHGLRNVAILGDATARTLLTDPGVLRFSFVRNPLARLHSAWADKIRLGDGPIFRPVIRALAPAVADDAPDVGPSGISFARFLDWVCEQPDAERDPHWASQAGLIFPQAIDYRLIGRVEQFDADVERLRPHLVAAGIAPDAFRPRRLNVSEVAPWREAYDARLAARVRDVFAADFEAFGYDPDDWRPRPGAPPRDLRRTVARRERQLTEAADVLERLTARAERAEALLSGTRPAELLPRAATTLWDTAPGVASCLDGIALPVAEALFDLARADTPGMALAVACALPGVVLPLAAGCLSRRTPRPCLAIDLRAPWSASGTRQGLLGGLASTGLAAQVQVVDLPIGAAVAAGAVTRPVGLLVLQAELWAETGPAALEALAPRLARGLVLCLLAGVAGDGPPPPPGFVECPAPEGLHIFRRG